MIVKLLEEKGFWELYANTLNINKDKDNEFKMWLVHFIINC